MDPTRMMGYEPHQSLTEHVLQFLDSLHKDSWLIPAIHGSEDWLKAIYDLLLQGTFINFKEEEIFTFGAWVYTIMKLTTPTPFAN
jgi:hypothetical protein